jgi:hypothetical protein
MDEIFEDLSPDEVKLLKRKIKDIEKEVLKRVWNQIKVLTIIVAFVLTAGGIISLSGIRDSIVNSASEKLKKDSKLRTEIITKIEKQIIQGVSNEIENIQDLKGEVNGLSNDIERERILAQKVLSRDLKHVRRMLERVYAEYYELPDTLENGQ